MNRRIISAALSFSIAVGMLGGFAMTASAAGAKTPTYQTQTRYMEELNRGLIASYSSSGVYLSWRLLGKESLENQAFDIYRGSTKIKTTGAHDATCYTDKNGKRTDKYRVVPAGTPKEQALLAPTQMTGTMTEIANDGNPYTYVDVPISKPTDIPHANSTKMSDYTRTDKSVGGPNDASLGDLDGDGDYEIVLKWDPNNSKDSNSGNTTGHCVFDAYEIDPNNGGYMWRIDIGNNIAAGAHYSQFMVYDFDGDGKAEIATLTAPGSYSLVKNESGGYDKIYVTTVGDTAEIRNANNDATTLRKGNNNGPEYYTIFDGETGRPLRTTSAIQIGPPDEDGVVDSSYEDGHYWGDSKMNRSSRYLAAVAYLDGVNPYYIPIRGMYNRTILRAYSWDGENLTLVKEHNGDKKGTTMYGEGNHNLSVADIDNDGKDEIVYGSACLDDDFKTVLGNTQLGHGDAMHVSDFNNDGTIEVFSVKEDGEGWSRGADFRVAKTGTAIWSRKVSTDNGRGAMDNIDDAYASTHPDALALGWDAANSGAYDFKGNEVAAKPKGSSRNFCNFLVYWDDDLGRELLDDNQMAKYHADTGATDRFFFNGQGYLPATSNNGTKQTPSLVADLWGDWREEIIMPAENDTVLRIMTSTKPTQYRLTTLMHDSQYRLSIAWQNVGYNQPPHTSYYIGSAALATDESGNTLNYLAPATKYTNVRYYSDDRVQVTGIEMPSEKLIIERSKEVDTGAKILPEEATKKTISWISSDENVVKVVGGKAIGVAPGTATITATTLDGGYTASREVEVWSEPVTGISLIDSSALDMQIDETAQVSVSIAPEGASDKNIKWTSSNESVATVSSKGVITAVSSGLVAIYATTVDGGYRTGCMVNVIPKGIVDLAGDDVFKTTNTDEQTKLNGASSTGATLSQTAAKTGGDMYKDFEVINDGKTTLTYRITTGGQKDSSNEWNWEGREYTFGMSLLDENGNNILTVAQPYLASGAGNMTSKVGSEAAVSFDSDWAGDRGDIQGSTKRWLVTFEFDYDAGTCEATIVGTDPTWATENGNKTKKFNLNGAHFKTLKCYTTLDNAAGAITASPIVENVSYETAVEISGTNVNVYKRGDRTGTAWLQSDVADWNGGADLKLENGRLWYNTTKPAAAYSATKTFDGIADNGTLTYDIDWHFGNATNRLVNVEYLQIGSDMRLGWVSADGGYYVFPSNDGGASYNGITDGAANASKAVFSGSGIHTKNIKVEIDVATRTVKSFKFDDKEVALFKGYTLPADATFNSVSFGFDRGGSTENWEYPNGIENIIVSQFGDDLTPSFNIRFVDTDGTLLDSKTLAAGETVAYTGTEPQKGADEKYAYTFAGWTPGLVGTAIDDAVYTAVYAKTPKSYTITLVPNGGTLESETISYRYGESNALPVPVKDGYTFGGWYDNENFSGTAITKVPADAVGNKTYYARWTSGAPMLKYTANGNKADIEFVVTEEVNSLDIIGVLYDGNTVKEVKMDSVSNFEAGTPYSRSLTFNNSTEGCTLKVYIWDSVEGMKPLI